MLDIMIGNENKCFANILIPYTFFNEIDCPN